MEDTAPRPLLIVGAGGTLGRAFARACDVRGIPYHVLARRELDVGDAASIDRVIARHRPWAVVNAAGYVRVDAAEHEVETCTRTNAVAPGVLAAACSRHDVRLVCFSSDLVFDGAHEPLQAPYVESDTPSPLSVYGRSKAEMEARVLHVLPEALVVRTAAFFGPWDTCNFVARVLASVRAGNPVRAALDEVVSPTYIVDLANVTLDLLIDREAGLWHLANTGGLSWATFAQRVAESADLPTGRIEAVPAYTLGHTARRPRYSVLGSERGALMPTLDDALARYLHDVEAERMSTTARRGQMHGLTLESLHASGRRRMTTIAEEAR